MTVADRHSGHPSRESFTVTIETSEPPERARLEIERALRRLWADVLVEATGDPGTSGGDGVGVLPVL